MGHKVHPVGFRLGISRDWQAHWFADKGPNFRKLLQEDLQIRKEVLTKYADASIGKVEIERGTHEVVVTIHTARPGIVIGRGGQRVEETRQSLEKLTGKRVRLNIQEVRQPELEAILVAKNIAEQIQRRVAYRRAMKQAVARSMQAGAKGVRLLCSGRLGGAEIARREKERQGQVPLHTLRADVDFGICEAHTAMGRVGVKAWIYRGDVVREAREVEEQPAKEQAATPPAIAPAPVAAAATTPAPAAQEVSKPDATTQKS